MLIDQQFLTVILVMGLIHFFVALGVWFNVWAWKGYKESDKEDRTMGFLMSCITFTGFMCFIVGILLTLDGILLGTVEFKP